MKPAARYGVGMCLAMLAAKSLQAANQPQAPDDSFLQLFVAEQLTYDDNLYRLPDSLQDDIGLLLGPGARHDDFLNRISLGAEGRWVLSRQALALSLRFDDSRFHSNDSLDNSAGNGKAKWDWRAGDNLSGELGADYDRALASFANNRFLARDLVETTGVFWNATLLVRSNWSLLAGVRHAQTGHSAASRRFDDFDSDSGNARIEYKTALGNTFGWDYRYSESRFDRLATLFGLPFDRDYQESYSGFRTRYALTGKLTLDANAGYLKRDYPQSPAQEINAGDFSGGTWEAAVQWQPTAKSGIRFAGWRRLSANLDAESDYFVAKGGSIEPVWNPTVKLIVALDLSYEEQEYLGSTVNFALLERRRDRVNSQQLTVTYTPLQILQIDLVLRVEQRDSDRPLLRYDDKAATVAVRWIY
jgi:hypothetical protein